MNYENLVDLIVKEVYKKIDNEKPQASNKPLAVVLFERDKNRFKEIEDSFEVVDFSSELRNCDIVIISRLCMRGLSNLASLSNASDEERFVLKMLMKGKKIYILNDGIEYKRYKNTAPKALYKKFVSLEDEISSFGVKVIEHPLEILDRDSQVKEERVQKPKETKLVILKDEALDLRGKKLISELDLKKPAINGIRNIIIDHKSIITPLAADFMRIQGIEVERL